MNGRGKPDWDYRVNHHGDDRSIVRDFRTIDPEDAWIDYTRGMPATLERKSHQHPHREQARYREFWSDPENQWVSYLEENPMPEGFITAPESRKEENIEDDIKTIVEFFAEMDRNGDALALISLSETPIAMLVDALERLALRVGMDSMIAALEWINDEDR